VILVGLSTHGVACKMYIVVLTNPRCIVIARYPRGSHQSSSQPGISALIRLPDQLLTQLPQLFWVLRIIALLRRLGYLTIVEVCSALILQLVSGACLQPQAANDIPLIEGSNAATTVVAAPSSRVFQVISLLDGFPSSSRYPFNVSACRRKTAKSQNTHPSPSYHPKCEFPNSS
jgi:hypothetical protein